jgi:hypothetical protein
VYIGGFSLTSAACALAGVVEVMEAMASPHSVNRAPHRLAFIVLSP